MEKNEFEMYEKQNSIKNYTMNSISYIKKFIRINFTVPPFSQKNILNNNFIVQFQAFVKLLFNFMCKFSGVSV